MLEEILLIIAGLAGLGGFVSILINLLKLIGLIKDGQSNVWYQSISLIIFVAVAVVYFIKAPVDWATVDGWLKLLTSVLGFVVQILGGQLTYTALKGAPVVGFSYSEKAEIKTENK